MKVHYDEGVANHIGPELCAGAREGMCEASLGVRVGQLLSHENALVPSADAVILAEGHTMARVIASAPLARRGLRLWHIRTLLAPGFLPRGLLDACPPGSWHTSCAACMGRHLTTLNAFRR